MADRTPVIVGIGLSDYPVAPHLDGVQHHVLAMQRALADSGVAKADIDGYMCARRRRARRSTRPSAWPSTSASTTATSTAR